MNTFYRTFVRDYLKPMLRHFITYFEEYYHQDALVFWVKTTIGMTVLNVPQYLPELQEGAQLFTKVIGVGSAILGFTLLCFKFYDEVKKRIKRIKK